MNKRIFLIVLDSFGIGNAPDAEKFNDIRANTLKTLYNSKKLFTPTLNSLGLYNIDGNDYGDFSDNPKGKYGRLIELSNAKDTVTGHWEMMNVISKTPFPTFPNGFPKEFIESYEYKIGRRVICNKPYSGTDVIMDYGKEHLDSGSLIIYTSADSVFQIAAHSDIISHEQLYEYCRIARTMLTGSLAVGRVIARPFTGEWPNFKRESSYRHDFSIDPPLNTLDKLTKNNIFTVSVGKIADIFNHRGISKEVVAPDNKLGMKKTFELLHDESFKSGLCFVNLVDFDMLYGHRRDVEGYVNALNQFDDWLSYFIKDMRHSDYLIVTADHGCDPSYSGNDHTRETVPFILYNKNIKSQNIGTIHGFNYTSSEIITILSV